METITREIIRNHDGHEAVYKFTTFIGVLSDISKHTTRPNLGRLQSHLQNVFQCEIIEKIQSPSGMPTLMLEVERGSPEGDLVRLAREANYRGLKSGQHWKVQEHFLANEEHTIAAEMPVFDENMLGCIDLVAYDLEFDIVKILDFKPNAHKEKHAATQLYWYRELLSKQSGIPKSKIECFYFDDMNCYRVKF